MDPETVTARRTLASRLGALFCTLAFLAVLDGLMAGFRTPVNLVNVLPGETSAIDGPAPEAAREPRDMAWKDDSRQPGALQVTINEIHRGYFLGAHRWRGRLTVSPALPPGKYALAIYVAENPTKGGMVFRVVVHPDAESLRQSSYSLIMRWLGVSPYAVAGGCLPFILLAFGAVFLLSQRLERLMATRGMAEIYRVVRKEGIIEVNFGLGVKQGVVPGARLTVLNPEGQTVGQVRVEEASDNDSVGVTGGDQDIKPGFVVTLH